MAVKRLTIAGLGSAKDPEIGEPDYADEGLLYLRTERISAH